MKLKSRKGFTIIEILIYLGIFSILLTITLQMFSSIFDIQVESEATSSVAADGKYIMNRFTYDVNRATSITTPSTLGSSTSSLALVINGQTYTYGLSNGNLILQNNTAGTADRLNSNDTTVSNLSFIRLDGGGKDTVQVSYTLTSEAVRRGGKQVVNYKTSAGIR
jgi:prepilin-type N-terminal cleavage/methylation domain-containing protein